MCDVHEVRLDKRSVQNLIAAVMAQPKVRDVMGDVLKFKLVYGVEPTPAQIEAAMIFHGIVPFETITREQAAEMFPNKEPK